MIKIEFSGTGDEVRNEMLKLLGLSELAKSVETRGLKRVAGQTPQVAEGQPVSARGRRARRGRKAATQPTIWTEEDATRLFNEIKDNAKKILVELANNPDGYTRSDLVRALGSSEQTIRGQLSSVGSALRRMGRKSSPISRTKINGEFTYKLDPVVANTAKQQ